ncbi:hypothetical protein PTMSG1_09571 [Pyrenophora teres f. maculata]|nr:hypothetical protein PTMSG1_09571 [Pyrenophora teres f. maculata]
MEKDKKSIDEAIPNEEMRKQEETHTERRGEEREQEDRSDDYVDFYKESPESDGEKEVKEAQGGAKGRRHSSSELSEIDESFLDYLSSTKQTETGGNTAAREKILGKKAPLKTGNSARTRKVPKKRTTSTSGGNTAAGDPAVTAAKNEKMPIIDAIKKNWPVSNISDIFPAKTWLKGPMRKFADDTWDKETLLDLHNLTVYDQHEVAKQLSKRFNDRNHGGDKTVRVGTDPITKERNLRMDLRIIYDSLRKNKRPAEEDGEEDRPIKNSRTASKATQHAISEHNRPIDPPPQPSTEVSLTHRPSDTPSISSDLDPHAVPPPTSHKIPVANPKQRHCSDTPSNLSSSSLTSKTTTQNSGSATPAPRPTPIPNRTSRIESTPKKNKVSAPTPETAHAAPASAIPLTSRLLSTTPPPPSAPPTPANTTQQSQQARLDYAANEWRQARQKLADAESTVDKILRQEIDEELGPMMKRVRELDEEVRRCGDSVARLRRRREE